MPGNGHVPGRECTKGHKELSGNNRIRREGNREVPRTGRADVVKTTKALVAGHEAAIRRCRENYVVRCQEEVEQLNKEVEFQTEDAARSQQLTAQTENDVRANPYKASDVLATHPSIAEIKKRLGNPESIIKHDFNHQTWIYQFTDGQVHVSVHSGGLGGSDDMGRDDTRVYLTPQEVEML